MDIDFSQIGLNLVISAGSAWTAGWFGIRHGLKRAQLEKSFDRRLKWHEDTILAFDGFKLSLKTFIETDALSSQLTELVKEVQQSAAKVRGCVGGATMYANKKTLVKMRKLFEELDQITHKPIGPNIKNDELTDKANAIADVADRIMFDLASSVRDLLDMDKINLKDFTWGRRS